MYNLNDAISALTVRILTPVLYMTEYSDRINFICFCDKNINMNDIHEAEYELTDMLGVPTEIIDIREFPENERMDILRDSTLVYTADPAMENIFIASVAEDYAGFMLRKKAMLYRYKNTGSGYLQ